MPGFAQKTAPVAKARAKTPSALSLRRSCGNQSTTQSAQNEREHSERGLAGTALDFTRIPAHSDSLPVQKRSVAQHDARRRDDERNECGPVVVSAPDRPRVVPSPVASNTAWVQRMCAACREEEKKVRACRTPRVQPKLLVGEDDDVHEREADRIAEKVVARSTDLAAGEGALPDGGPRPTMDPGSDAELRSGGARLPDHVRRFFEAELGYELGHVRVHEGAEAAQRNCDVRAHAFTYGNHIWLGRNQWVAPSFVMAHELVHVVQQTQPARVADIADDAGTDEGACCASPGFTTTSVPRVQRIDVVNPYWDPGDHDGAKNHQLVLPEIGMANNIFTEAPVPNGSKAGAALGVNVEGEADFYQGTSAGTPRTVGVAYRAAGEPVELKSNKDSKFAGEKFSHKTESAPRPGGGFSAAAIIRIDEAPNIIRVADLKPGYGTPEAAEGTGQLDNYIQGFRIAQRETNDLAKAGKGEPKGARWSITTIEKIKNLTIPAKFKEPLGAGQTSKKLVLKQFPSTKIVPKQDVLGKIFVKKDPGKEGIFNYVWKPDNPRTGAGGLPATLSNLKRGIQKDIIVPATTLPKAKRIKGALAARSVSLPSAQGDASRKLRRKQEKAPVETFDLKVYNEAVDKYTAQWKGFEKTADFQDARFKTFAARAAIGSHAAGFDVDATEEQKQNVETFRSIEFWTGASAKTVGVFRKVFGRTFVKVLQFYEKARDKLLNLFKSKSAPSGGGGLPGAVLKAAYKIIKAAARLLVQRTASELFGSFQRGATEWVKSLLPAETTEKLEEKIQEIDALQKEIEDKVKAEVEELVGQTLGPYEQIIADFEAAAAAASAIATVVNIVKWGMRVVACLAPPAWGCLWVLAQPVAEYLAAQAVETCWFQRAAAPLLTGIEYVKNIPKRLANLIIDGVIKKILPTSLHRLFPEIEISAEVKPEELECESPDSNRKDAAMRSALLGMANALGEDRVVALADLTKAAGVDPGKELAPKDVACLRGSILDAGLSSNQLKEYAKQYPKRPEGVPDSLEACLKAGAKSTGAHKPPATPPPPLAGETEEGSRAARGVAGTKPPAGKGEGSLEGKGGGTGPAAGKEGAGKEGKGGGDFREFFDFCPKILECAAAAHPIFFAAEDDRTLGLRAELASLDRTHLSGGSLLRSKNGRGPLVLKPTGDTFDVFLRDLDDVDHLIGKAKTSSQPGEFEVISGAILDQFRAAAKKWERHFNIPASQSRLHRFRFR